MKIPRPLAIFAILWTVAFWVICIGIPIGFILFHSGMSHQNQVFSDSVVLRVVRITLWQALCSTLFSGSLGLILGLLLGRVMALRPKTRLTGLFAVPYGVPTVVAATAWLAWFGRNGILSQFGIHLEWSYTLKSVILAHVFLNTPWVALWVAQARKSLSQDELEAAASLGAGLLSQFRFVTWPAIRWALMSACAQVFSLCLMSFSLVLILGGGPPVQTLETLLFQRLRYGTVDLGGATACGFWQLILTLAPWVFILLFESKIRRRDSRVEISSGIPPGVQKRDWVLYSLFGISLFFVLPYFAVLSPRAFLFDYGSVYREQIWAPLRISLILAFSTGILTVFTAILSILSLQIVEKRLPLLSTGLGILLVLPSGISVLVLGLGVWLAYGQWLDPFEGSWIVLVGVQSTLFFPIAFRLLWPFVHHLQIPQLEAAVSLGASPIAAFRWIELPRWRGAIITAFATVAGASLGELGAVSLFYSEKWISLPLLISRWMQQYHFEEAQGVAGFLFLLSMILIVGSLELEGRLFRNRLPVVT